MNKTKLDFDEVNIMQEYNTIEFAKETDDNQKIIIAVFSRDMEIIIKSGDWMDGPHSAPLFWNAILLPPQTSTYPK